MTESGAGVGKLYGTVAYGDPTRDAEVAWAAKNEPPPAQAPEPEKGSVS